MDTRILKILIAAASLVYTVYLFIGGYIWSGIGMTFVTAVAVLFNFRSIRMIIAFFNLRQQKLDKARKWINRINPDKLWKSRRGYYHFIDGTVKMQENDISGAERSMKKALNLGLKQSHDKAAAKLNLAMVAMSKNRQKEAKILMMEAKKLDVKNVLKKDINAIEKHMRKPGKVQRQKHARRF